MVRDEVETEVRSTKFEVRSLKYKDHEPKTNTLLKLTKPQAGSLFWQAGFGWFTFLADRLQASARGGQALDTLSTSNPRHFKR
jgi:hypothetical protein